MFSKLVTVIKKIRAWEALMMTPFFLIGYFYTQPKLSEICNFNFGIVIFHFYLLVQSIYLLNSFYGRKSDKLNKRFQGITIETKNSEVLFVVISLLLLFFAWSINYINNWGGELLIPINYLLWLLYASPTTNFKSHFISGSVIHFISGVINFQLGYQVNSHFSFSSISISIYFALLFVFGHMHHMIIDYEADKAAKHQTLAVKIGIRKTSNLSILLVSTATFFYIALALLGIVIPLSIIPVVIAFLSHLFLYIKLKPKLSNFEQRISYRKQYRIIHALSMLIIVGIYLYAGTL